MITVIGSINLDLTATTARLPEPGETVLGKDFLTAPGGKGANQALAVLRGGAPLRFIGAVGDDTFADQALAELTHDRADLSGVAALPGATGVAAILVDGQGENVIVVVPGANAKVSPQMAEQAVAAMAHTDTLLLQQEVPAETLHAALTAARNQGIRTILNIAPILPETKELAALADIVIANETEFAHLVGGEVPSPAGSAREWARRTGKTLVLTLGPVGALAATPDGLDEAPAMQVTPVDTVGAGDTFCGFFSAGLDTGSPLGTALRRAAIAGSLACLKSGAQPAIPHKEDVDAVTG